MSEQEKINQAAYVVFSKVDSANPEEFAKAVSDPKNRYPIWLRNAALEFLANIDLWKSKYSIQGILSTPVDGIPSQ